MIYVRLILLALAAGLALVGQSGAPISRAKFMKAVEIGGIQPEEFIGILQAQGVDFQLTEDERKKLAERGIQENVIKAVTSNFRPAAVTGSGPVAPASSPTAVGGNAQVQTRPAQPDGDDIVAGGAKPRGPVVESSNDQELVAGSAPRMRATAPIPTPASSSAAPKAASLKAVAVIVHKDNPLATIDSSLLRRIYTGEQSTWKSGRSIYVIDRGPASTARRAFYKRALKVDANKTFYLQGMSMVFRPQTHEMGSTVRSYVSRMPDAIGYVELSEVDASVKVLAVNGVFPTEEAVTNRTYPLFVEE